MSCTRVRFPESTMTGRSVGDRFTDSAVTVKKGYTTRAKAESRYARYLAGEGRERWRNQMKTSFIVMMLIVMTAALFYVMIV